MRKMLSAGAAASATLVASAGTIHVPGDAPTIQAALASAIAGDEIVLAAGQYNIGTGLTFPSDGVTLRGATGDAADVVLRGNGAQSPIFLTARSGLVFADLTMTDCVNAIRASQSDLRLERCVFFRNTSSASFVASAVLGTRSDITVIDCRFANNTSASDGTTGAIIVAGGRLVVEGSAFVSNTAGPGPVTPSAFGAAISAIVFFNAPAAIVEISDSEFINNTSDFGAAISADDALVTIDRCRFLGNTATLGGAIFIRDADLTSPPVTASVTVTNSAFSGNHARRSNGLNGFGGAAAGTDGATVKFINSTLWNNTAEALAAGAWSGDAGGLTVHNSILAGAVPQTLVAPGGAITASNLSASSANGAGLVDPDGPDGLAGTADDDLRLAPASPAIDAGDNALLAPAFTLDLAGLPRRTDDPATPDTGPGSGPGTGPVIDIGAYEFQPAGPCSPADLAPPFGQLTFADISAFLAAFASQDPVADLASPAGQFTFADITAFLAAFNAGCP